jgi:hypothetical protein
MKNNEWYKIQGFNKYEINKQGQIRNIETLRYLKYYNHNDYPSVTLRVDDKNNIKKKKNLFVHRLVAITFIDNKDKLPYVNHKDGIRSNYSISNLEWCDEKYNSQHARNVTKNLTVISRPKIIDLYNKNITLDKDELINLIIENCR